MPRVTGDDPACPVERIAQEVVSLIEAQDETERLLASTNSGVEKADLKRKLAAIEDKIDALENSASFERARSRAGVLFQIMTAADIVMEMAALGKRKDFSPGDAAKIDELARRSERLLSLAGHSYSDFPAENVGSAFELRLLLPKNAIAVVAIVEEMLSAREGRHGPASLH